VKGKLKSGNEPNEEVDSAVLRCPHTESTEKQACKNDSGRHSGRKKERGKEKKGILNSLL